MDICSQSKRPRVIGFVTAACVVALILGSHSVQAEILSSEGESEADLVRKGKGYECETAGLSNCKLGQICYGKIEITGEAARVLYEAMRPHGTKIDDFSQDQYVGTRTDALTCWAIAGEYGCAVGYDALTNTLSPVGVSRIGMGGFGECE
jgi:hypothetical protein